MAMTEGMTTPYVDRRRVKLLYVSPQVLVDLCKHNDAPFGLQVTANALPADAEAVAIDYDPFANTAKIVVRSASFDIVDAGLIPPILPNPEISRRDWQRVDDARAGGAMTEERLPDHLILSDHYCPYPEGECEQRQRLVDYEAAVRRDERASMPCYGGICVGDTDFPEGKDDWCPSCAARAERGGGTG